jgi:uncharacterized protein YdcH (DUF465 family)
MEWVELEAQLGQEFADPLEQLQQEQHHFRHLFL